MKIDKINANNKPVFKKMIIAKPEIWPAEVLDSFVKNKEIQELTRDLASKNRDLTACCICNAKSGIITLFNNLDLIHKFEANGAKNLQKQVEQFSRKDIKRHFISKEEQDRLDNVQKYVEEFNKTLELRPQTDKPKKEKSFWKKFFGK